MVFLLHYRMKGDFMDSSGRGVDYEKLIKSQQFKEYEELASQLSQADISILSENEKKAFFISILQNLFHSIILKAKKT